MEIRAQNVNDAFGKALRYMYAQAVPDASRNGKVFVAPEPVTTYYEQPTERVLFSPLRDANPFFHLMEAIWMIAGRNDVAFIGQFNKHFVSYSDNGKTFHGAYGRRWRSWFACDQILELANLLTVEPTTRRAVLTMWDGFEDLSVSQKTGSKDVPCNTQAYFQLNQGRLDMTVLNRSNDIIWGTYGANAVHFSVLQEILAALLAAPVGRYIQFSNNFHIYPAKYPESNWQALSEDALAANYYERDYMATPTPLVTIDAVRWTYEASLFCDNPEGASLSEPFFTNLAVPAYRAWARYRAEDLTTALTCIPATGAWQDWRTAMRAWLLRRLEKRNG